jgi:ribosome-binding factor A
MKPYRGLKIGSVIEHELNNLLLREFEFGDALVTITSVEVSPDLLQVKVGIGIIPGEKGQEVLRILENKKRELQYKLLKKTRLRSVPKIIFEISNN